MSKILFYYPSNKRSNVIETTLRELKNLGHEVLFLSTIHEGLLHDAVEKMGITTFAIAIKKKNPILYYFRQVRFLIKTCKDQKVDVVFSHLQHANLIAAFAQYFIKSRVIAFRHHFKISKRDFKIDLEIDRNELMFDRIINLLAKEIIVPAESIKANMIKYEKVDPGKIKVIPYMYDYSRFQLADRMEVQRIKTDYPAHLRLIMVSRLVPFKRHREILPLMVKLINEGMDLKLLMLDDGPEESWISSFIRKHKMETSLFLLGYQQNPLAYIEASDLLIHPSLTEASSNVVKEAGLLSKAVAVCKGVGDFDEYIEDGSNGFLLDPLNPNLRLEEIIRMVYSDKSKLEIVGDHLKATIQSKFLERDSTIELYNQLINDPL